MTTPAPAPLSRERPSKPEELGGAAGAADVVPLRHGDGSPIVNRKTVRAIVAIAEAVFARDGRAPSPERLAWIEREMEDFLARSGSRSRVMFSFMVWLTTRLAPLFAGRFSPLYSLPLDARIHALARLEERFSEPLLAVKAILCLVYYEHPDAASDVGFDGQCLLPRGKPGGAT